MALLYHLYSYTPYNPTEAEHLQQVIDFLQHAAQPFHRETLIGHVTGSAIVTNSTTDQILLLHHRQLGRWLQPGGHCDGDADTLAVAIREVQEETGLTQITPVTDQIFDIDVHRIPAKGNVPEHWHYDIRYWFTANATEPLQKAVREAIEVQWIPLSQLLEIAPEASFERVEAKLRRAKA